MTTKKKYFGRNAMRTEVASNSQICVKNPNVNSTKNLGRHSHIARVSKSIEAISAYTQQPYRFSSDNPGQTHRIVLVPSIAFYRRLLEFTTL